MSFRSSGLLLLRLLCPGAYACSDGDTVPDRAGDGGGSQLDAAQADRSLDATLPTTGDADGPTIPGSPPVGPPDAAPDTGTGDGGRSLDAALPPDAAVPCDPSVPPTLPKLNLEPVPGITGLTRLVFAAQPPGSRDWYLVQQTGTVHVLSDGVLSAAPFLDLSSQVAQNLGLGDERGLLSIAFPPDYATSHKFYVALTPTEGADSNRDTVLEYERVGDVAGSAPSRTLLQLPVSAVNHNGGTLAFDSKGLLYVGTGDGGGGCNDNQPGAPQDVNSPFGKLLRLDPSVASAPYAAANNPFAAGGGDSRVLHYGLRNPFRYGVDRLTGDLYLGDVGQNLYEEADFAPAGASALNFGWPKYEGMHVDTCGADKALREGSTYTPPIVDVARAAGSPPPYGDWISIIGGRVYRGRAIPQLFGVYIYGDYLGKRMATLRQCGGTTSERTAIAKNRDANDPSALSFGVASPGQPPFDALTAIVEGDDGELYFVANRSSLLKVVPAP